MKTQEIMNKVNELVREKEVALTFASAKNRMFEAMLLANNPVEIEKVRQECIDAFTAYLDKCIEVNTKMVALEKSIL